MQCYEEKLRKKQGLWACGSLDRESTGIAKGSMLIAATRLMSTISLTERHLQILVPLWIH